MSIAVIFDALVAASCAVIADALAELSQPDLRPGEFHAEDCKANRNNHDGRPGRHDHYNADGEHGAADDQYRDSSRNFVSDSGCIIHRP